MDKTSLNLCWNGGIHPCRDLFCRASYAKVTASYEKVKGKWLFSLTPHLHFYIFTPLEGSFLSTAH
jgi:hypothetical protein